MDHNTQSNAAMVEETTAAANELRRETFELVQSVSSFQVARGASTKAPGLMARSATRSSPTPTLRSIGGSNGGSTVRKAKTKVVEESWEEF
jgi:methyl-accepting chemotaxis protein